MLNHLHNKIEGMFIPWGGGRREDTGDHGLSRELESTSDGTILLRVLKVFRMFVPLILSVLAVFRPPVSWILSVLAVQTT